MKESLKKLAPFLALAIVFLGFTIYNPNMASLVVLEKLGQQTVIVGIAALGMTLIIISGGIDLSAGSLIALTSVIMAQAITQWHFPAGLAALLGITAGLLAGWINGFLITRLKMVPFIVTLGTLLLYRGLAKALAHSTQIKVPATILSDFLAALPPERSWQLLPPGAWLMLLLAALTAFLLTNTPWGRHVVAIGSNEATAHLCGIHVKRIKIMVYSLGGFFTGLAGLMQLSYQEQGDPIGAEAYELDIIAAVVIGGGSLSGGQGSMLGTLLGAALMTVIRFGCQLNGFPPWVTQMATGTIIIIAVAIDQLRRHRLRPQLS